MIVDLVNYYKRTASRGGIITVH